MKERDQLEGAPHNWMRCLFVALLLFTLNANAAAIDRATMPPTSSPGSMLSPEVKKEARYSAFAQTKYTDANGYTYWRNEVNAYCSFSDHNFTLNIDADPAEMSDISYIMTNYDVDYQDPQGCTGGPEVDIMHFNSHELGVLTGANDSWSINTYPLTSSQVVQGDNAIYIDTDAPGTGCWCVGVGYIEVKAKVGFSVKSYTPQDQDKNRDFHADKLGLTVTFSAEYDPATLTNSTFKLEYLGSSGYQSVAGSFERLSAEQFRFKPDANLLDGIRYRATVVSGANGVKGKGGGELDQNEVFYFWTVPDLSLTDNFDYGSGSICAPSTAPCKGLDLNVFQVAKNAPLVYDKPAVARLYLRWKKHAGVADSEQVKEIQVEASITVNGTTTKANSTVKRPDRYTAAQKIAAANTVNLYHTPSGGSAYSAVVRPLPQTNATVVEYSQNLDPGTTGKKPSLKFDYYFLKDGSWAAGVPAAAKTDGRNTMNAGVQFVTDQFPVVSTSYSEKGEYSIGYTMAGKTQADASCGNVQVVNCPYWLIFSEEKAEYMCVYEKLLSMKGGRPFVAATVPNTLCAGATAFAMGDDVFMHQSGTGANDGTVAHEIGHIFGISAANSPTSGHRNSSSGVEGFQVRTKVNRSFVENPTKAISLMHTTLQPTGTQWVDNSDYIALQGSAIAGLNLPDEERVGVLAATNSYLIVNGYVDLDASSASVTSMFLQDVPNDSPPASSSCSVALLDSSDNELVSVLIELGLEITVHSASGVNSFSSLAVSGPQFFSASVPWDDSTSKLQLSCNGSVLLTEQRSAVAPVVDFSGLTDGTTLAGVQLLSWSGSDSDSSQLAYQLQIKEAGGADWVPLLPLTEDTSYSLNTTLLPDGSDQQLRIMATDGLNTSYATRTVHIQNGLLVKGVMPADGATDVDRNATISVIFSSDIDESTLSSSSFSVGGVTGTISYSALARTATLHPATPLAASTTYTATVSGVTDPLGSSVPTTTWSFTTGGDTTPPQVVSVSPSDGALGQPLNLLVQAVFDENVNSLTVTNGGFELLDGNGASVSGTFENLPNSNEVVFLPSAELSPNTTYTARLNTTITDTSSNANALEQITEWRFTTGTLATDDQIRIIGNYRDTALDTNDDGLFESLKVDLDVEVLFSGTFNLNGRLVDDASELIDWASSGSLSLNVGVHTVTLEFDGTKIRNNGVHGPYTLDSLNFYYVSNTAIADIRFNAFKTLAYDVGEFYSILTLGPLPDQLININETVSVDNAFDLDSYSTHITPNEVISYSVLVNTNPDVSVTIDGENNVDFVVTSSTEEESEITIQAVDSQNNTIQSKFHISAQLPKASQLAASYNTEMEVSTSQSITLQIKDQFDQLFTESVTISASTTSGSVNPVTVDSLNGEATLTFTASEVGRTFITLTAGTASTTVAIDVVEGSGSGGGGGGGGGAFSYLLSLLLLLLIARFTRRKV